MTQVSRKGFRDKNGKQVVIVPNVPSATAGNLPKFDENGNLQDSGLAAGDVITNIEVEDLSELDNITSPGVYHVVVYNKSGTGPTIITTSTAKILFVNGSLRGGFYKLSQYLFDRYSIMYRTRTKTVIGFFWSKWDETNIENILEEPDDTPTKDSNKLVTSGGVKAALDGKMSSAYSLLIAKDVSSYSTWGQEDADALNNFIASHKEYEEVICKIVLNDYSSLSTIGYAVGLATWRYKTDSHAVIVVRINVGAKEFIVSGQVSQDDERYVDNWARNWERTDYSSLF